MTKVLNVSDKMYEQLAERHFGEDCFFRVDVNGESWLVIEEGAE